jgi:hypothetical protein
MAFHPLSIFKEKVESKPVPTRGPGGKFVSKKPKEEPKEEKKPAAADEGPTGPYPVTFYGHEIRRFRYKNDWYFALEDIGKTAYLNPDDPRVRKGDAEKLSESKKKYALKFDGIEVAKPKDIISFVPYFKGNMPGPITSWLEQNSNAPVPEVPETANG